jgi:hypothetical protein
MTRLGLSMGLPCVLRLSRHFHFMAYHARGRHEGIHSNAAIRGLVEVWRARGPGGHAAVGISEQTVTHQHGEHDRLGRAHRRRAGGIYQPTIHKTA